ncbi:hypothetical protein Tco_0996332 [Tanacetum coccineum]
MGKKADDSFIHYTTSRESSSITLVKKTDYYLSRKVEKVDMVQDYKHLTGLLYEGMMNVQVQVSESDGDFPQTKFNTSTDIQSRRFFINENLSDSTGRTSLTDSKGFTILLLSSSAAMSSKDSHSSLILLSHSLYQTWANDKAKFLPAALLLTVLCRLWLKSCGGGS